MNHATVTSLVVERAKRFGERNAQEFSFLQSRLSQVEPQELLDGLLNVFAQAEAPPAGSPQQELAGRLLEALQPQGKVQVDALIRCVAPRYELSVEQFPQYLAQLCGKSEVILELQKLAAEPGMATQQRALETMAFWLGARLQPLHEA